MKRLRRMAALLLALSLGVAAWCVIALSFPSRGELRLSRELSTGALMARVPRPRPLFFGLIFFGPAKLSARYEQGENASSGNLPQRVLLEAPGNAADQIWYVRLDPLDKTWELEVRESRAAFFRLGKSNWRIGTRTRIWRTQRRNATAEPSVDKGRDEPSF
jgi:hypothetical protein